MEIALSNWTIYRYNSAGIKISRLMTIYRLVAMLHVRQSQPTPSSHRKKPIFERSQIKRFRATYIIQKLRQRSMGWKAYPGDPTSPCSDGRRL